MVNCNPETVSTDYDTADRLYFEPLTAEDVIELVEVERASGELLGVIVQFGGQTPLKLAQPLEAAGIPILGTSPDAIDLAEDRERFQKLLQELGLRQPENGTRDHRRSRRSRSPRRSAIRWWCARPTCSAAARWRSSTTRAAIERYMRDAVKVSGEQPGPDRPLPARRHRGRCRCAGRRTRTSSSPASWSTSRKRASIPATRPARCRLIRCRPKIIAEIERQTEAMAKALHVVGLMNVQYRREGRRDLRPRGESARLPHGAVRRQGDRRADRQDRRARDGRARRSSRFGRQEVARASTSRSRKRCSPSPASRASTSSSGRR